MRSLYPISGIVLLAAMAMPLAAQEKPESNTDKAIDVVTSPIKAVNIDPPKVPPLLETALKAPYSSADTKSCKTITAAIQALDNELGRDADQPVPKGKDETSTELAFAAAQSAIGSFIPGLGLIKQISGAAKAEKHVRAAVFAGALRRGYLKGLGQAHGCKPPAAPLPAAMKVPPAVVAPAK